MKKFQDYDRIGVGQRLRQLRWARRLTIQEASQQAGVSFSQLSKLETGGSKMGMDSLVRLADFYGVSRSEILEGKEAGAGNQAQLSTNHVTHIKATNRSVVVNGHSPVQRCGEVIDATVKIATDEAEIAKARVIAQTLGCPFHQAMAMLVKQKLEN